jgi:signal transduction histidine kinase
VEDPPVEKLPELIALLTHDLRNPLAALLANLNFVGSTLVDRGPDVALALGDAKTACSMLEQLIANLDFLAIVLRSTEAPPRAVSLHEAVGAAISRQRAPARALGVDLELFVTEACPKTVLVEAALFGRAIDNLLANALQYSPERGRVRVELGRNEDRGVVSILDDGPLVPAAFRSAVLTVDGQINAKQIRHGRYGRGLGLYCAARAAILSGARVQIAERDGRSVLELSAPITAER